MANIKIVELQSDLIEELSDVDLEAVNGGDGAQFTGSSSGTILGFSLGGGRTNVTSTSISNLSGTPDNFLVSFGTQTSGFTLPF